MERTRQRPAVTLGLHSMHYYDLHRFQLSESALQPRCHCKWLSSSIVLPGVHPLNICFCRQDSILKYISVAHKPYLDPSI